MIARPLPYEEVPRSPRGTRSGRNAAYVRRKRTRRQRYANIARIFTTVGILTVAIVVYLALMANVTRMNYELAKTVHAKTALVDESSRLDDRIARLVTSERLAVIAKHLGMHEPDTFARITLPRAHPGTRPAAPHGIAFLTWLK